MCPAQGFGSKRGFSEAKSQGARSPQCDGWGPRAQGNVQSMDYEWQRRKRQLALELKDEAGHLGELSLVCSETKVFAK